MFIALLLPLGGVLAGHAVGEVAVARRRHELGLDAIDDTRDEAIQFASWRRR